MNGKFTRSTSGIKIRAVLAILSAVVFALLAAGTSFAWSVNQVLLNPLTYTRMIEQTNLVGAGRIYLVGLFSKMAEDKTRALPLFNNVPQEGWQEMVQGLLPNSWVEKTVKDTVQATVSWMGNKDQRLPDIAIDLKPIQDNLRSQQGTTAILLISHYFPTCSLSQGLLGLFQTGKISCIPVGADLSPLAPLLAQAVAQLLPDQIVVSASNGGGILTALDSIVMIKLHLAYQLIPPGLSLGLRLSLFFLSLYGLLTSVSPRSLLRASPWPFYAAGILTIILILLGYAFSRPFLTWLFRGISPQGNIDIRPILVNGILSMSGEIGRFWLWWAVLILSIGIILHLVWRIVERKQRGIDIDESSRANIGSSAASTGRPDPNRPVGNG